MLPGLFISTEVKGPQNKPCNVLEGKPPELGKCPSDAAGSGVLALCTSVFTPGLWTNSSVSEAFSLLQEHSPYSKKRRVLGKDQGVMGNLKVSQHRGSGGAGLLLPRLTEP